MLTQFRRSLAHGNHLGIICLVVAIALFISGGVSIIRGLSAQRAVAETRNLGDIPKTTTQPKASQYLPYADPVAITIPSIDVTSPLITVGKAPDGSIDVPKAPDFDKAAWYRGSPAPGQFGAAVIVGHVDSYANNGASIFYNLAKLKPGDTITIERSDKNSAVFKVYATRYFDRKKLPADEVYNAHTGNAELRLITCAGTFDRESDSYSGNTVNFASLIKTPTQNAKYI